MSWSSVSSDDDEIVRQRMEAKLWADLASGRQTHKKNKKSKHKHKK